MVMFEGVPAASPFSINAGTGSITLDRALDTDAYKDQSSFTLNVSATDDGSCCTAGVCGIDNDMTIR